MCIRDRAEEVQTGMIEWKLIRGTIHRYTAAKFCGAFLGAGSAVCLAFFAHALLWNLLATPCDPSINEYLALPFAEDCIYACLLYTSLSRQVSSSEAMHQLV